MAFEAKGFAKNKNNDKPPIDTLRLIKMSRGNFVNFIIYLGAFNKFS